MSYLDIIFEKKQKLLDVTRIIYENALKTGFTLEEIIQFDFDQQEKNYSALLEKFQEYNPSQEHIIEKYCNDDFKNLITEKINENYSFGRYGDFKIVINNESGYVNGTQLLKQALLSENTIRLKINKKNLDSAKVDDWYSLKGTSELLEMVAYEENLKIEQLRFNIHYKQKKGEEDIRGTYIHPVLVNSLAFFFCIAKKRGMSPCYAVKINKLINELNINSQKKVINSLKLRVDNYSNIIEQMREEYNKISEDRKIILHKADNVIKKLEVTTNRLCKAVGLIDEVKYDSLYIFKIQINHDSPIYYTCYRILKDNEKKTFAKHENYVIADCIYEKCSVNSTKAWIEFKKDKNRIFIKTSFLKKKETEKFYNDFVFLNKYTEHKLKSDFDQLFIRFDNLNF